MWGASYHNALALIDAHEVQRGGVKGYLGLANMEGLSCSPAVCLPPLHLPGVTPQLPVLYHFLTLHNQWVLCTIQVLQYYLSAVIPLLFGLQLGLFLLVMTQPVLHALTAVQTSNDKSGTALLGQGVSLAASENMQSELTQLTCSMWPSLSDSESSSAYCRIHCR